MREFELGGMPIKALDRVEGFFIDPVLPEDFDDTDNTTRPEDHLIWWDVPFIVSARSDEAAFRKEFPAGVRFDVRCLDGGAWDRSTWWGTFPTILEAVACASAGPHWRSSGGSSPFQRRSPPPGRRKN